MQRWSVKSAVKLTKESTSLLSVVEGVCSSTYCLYMKMHYILLVAICTALV